MAFVLGKDAKLYRNTGTYGSPTWDEVPNASKVKIGLSATKFNARRRASGAFHQEAVTGIQISASWRMLFDLADTDFTAIQTAFTTLAELDMIVLSGSSASGANVGPRISAAFDKFDRDEDEDGLLVVDVGAVAGVGFVPAWFTGTS